MANSGNRDTQNAATKPVSRRQPYGEQNTIDQKKCREQVKLGEYPKRRSDDEY